MLSPINLSAFDADKHLMLATTWGLKNFRKHVAPKSVDTADGSILLYEYNTQDKGLIPTWFSENHVSSYPYVSDFLSKYESDFDANGIRVVEHGRPDFVVKLPYVMPYYHSRYYKKCTFVSTFHTEWDDECVPLIAESIQKFLNVTDEYIGGVPDNLCRNHIFKTYSHINGELLAVSNICQKGDEWYWVNSYRRAGVNMEMLIIHLMKIAELNGMSKFNLGVSFFSYKIRFNPELVWEKGLEYKSHTCK